jgi:hypothetical protein
MRSRRASAPPLILPPLSPNPNSIYGIVLKAQHSEGHTNDHVLLLFSYNVLLEAISRAGGGRFRVERTNLTPTDLDEEVVSSPFHSFHVSDFCVFLCPHAIERCTDRYPAELQKLAGLVPIVLLIMQYGCLRWSHNLLLSW